MRFQIFSYAIEWSKNQLLQLGKDVDAGRWQGYKTEGKPDLITKEILNLQLEVPTDRAHGIIMLAEEIEPNRPWADDHFEERVSRDPSNPGVEYKNWPWWRGQEAVTDVTYKGIVTGGILTEGKEVPPPFQFTHTYQERFWPKWANRHEADDKGILPNQGIRYDYGDLDDVVNLLFHEPYTRQATFPIFFPEDTGAVHGGRIPCTLHYHFLLRDNFLHLWYPIRSCDYVRHFRDDLYMACRLLYWVLEELQEKELRSDEPQRWFHVKPGTLYFTAYSFHVHMGDLHHVRA